MLLQLHSNGLQQHLELPTITDAVAAPLERTAAASVNLGNRQMLPKFPKLTDASQAYRCFPNLQMLLQLYSNGLQQHLQFPRFYKCLYSSK